MTASRARSLPAAALRCCGRPVHRRCRPSGHRPAPRGRDRSRPKSSAGARSAGPTCGPDLPAGSAASVKPESTSGPSCRRAAGRPPQPMRPSPPTQRTSGPRAPAGGSILCAARCRRAGSWARSSRPRPGRTSHPRRVASGPRPARGAGRGRRVTGECGGSVPRRGVFGPRDRRHPAGTGAVRVAATPKPACREGSRRTVDVAPRPGGTHRRAEAPRVRSDGSGTDRGADDALDGPDGFRRLLLLFLLRLVDGEVERRSEGPVGPCAPAEGGAVAPQSGCPRSGLPLRAGPAPRKPSFRPLDDIGRSRYRRTDEMKGVRNGRHHPALRLASSALRAHCPHPPPQARPTRPRRAGAQLLVPVAFGGAFRSAGRRPGAGHGVPRPYVRLPGRRRAGHRHLPDQ